jgi:hypothetical protein
MNRKTITEYFSSFFAWIKNAEKRDFFLKWYDSQPTSAKVGFYGAFVIGLLTHITMYSELILERHMPSFIRLGHPEERWFHNWILDLNFNYLNWVIGLQQLLVISLFVFIVIKAFNIKNRLYALLIAGVAATFPSIAEINLHFHDASPYLFSAFLAILAFYVTKLYKYGFTIGLFLIMLCLAIYQSSISLAMMAIIIHLIIYILDKRPSLFEITKYTSRFFCTIVGGVLAYYSYLQINDITPSATQGRDTAFTLDGMFEALLNVTQSYNWTFQYFFSTTNETFRDFRIPNDYLMYSYAFIFILIVITLIIVIKLRDKRDVMNAVVIMILVLLLPVVGNLTSLFDIPEIILTTTTYQFMFYLILPLILWENFKVNIFGLKKIAVIALIFIIGYYISFTNFIYFQAQISTNHAMHLANRVANDIEPLLPYSEDNLVLIHGDPANNPIYPDTKKFADYKPRARTGMEAIGGHETLGSWPQNFFKNVIRERIGIDFDSVECLERRQDLLNEAIANGQPVYPLEGSTTIIDGVVVVIFNFFGIVDVDETTPGNFIVNVKHTGKSSNLEFEYIWYLYRDGERVYKVYEDLDGTGYFEFEIDQPGNYQFKVNARLVDGTYIFEEFSQMFEVR